MTAGCGKDSSMPRLRHVDCADAGFTRRRRGSGFSYLDVRERPIRDAETVERIRDLAIPPAWRDVWICPAANGHLQAVGTDDAGRRQYLYHPAWREHRDRAKFDEMLRFAEALPAGRRKVSRLLGEADLSRDRVLAFAVALLDRGLFRVGGERYASDNGSHGLATLERRHVALGGRSAVSFAFEGKSGQFHEFEVRGRSLRRVAGELLETRRRGRFLAYRNGGHWHEVRAEDVNAFLKGLVGEEFSAKNFRTWHATVLAAVGVAAAGPARETAARRRVVLGTIKEVAAALGNTPAVCRASYVDPRVFDCYRAGKSIDSRLSGPEPLPLRRRQAVESAVVRLLSAQSA
jgi:DNA topoisomerase-1